MSLKLPNDNEMLDAIKARVIPRLEELEERKRELYKAYRDKQRECDALRALIGADGPRGSGRPRKQAGEKP